jgi:hypothetical protein
MIRFPDPVPYRRAETAPSNARPRTCGVHR